MMVLEMGLRKLRERLVCTFFLYTYIKRQKEKEAQAADVRLQRG